MTTLSLTANPTFKKTVAIPVAGGPSVDVEMTFKHRTKTQLIDFQNTLSTEAEGQTDPEIFMSMVVGWNLDYEFNVENVTALLENYIGAAWATYDVYRNELIRAKTGN